MGKWFKYGLGYVNIDDNSLYLTNTGNWEEALKLEEKSIKTKRKNETKKTRIVVFIAVVIVLFTFLFFKHMISNRISLLVIIGLPLAGYYVYNYLRTEIGSSYKIPIQKIQNVVIENRKVSIEFINAEGVADVEMLNNVEEKGIVILKEIHLYNKG